MHKGKGLQDSHLILLDGKMRVLISKDIQKRFWQIDKHNAVWFVSDTDSWPDWIWLSDTNALMTTERQKMAPTQ